MQVEEARRDCLRFSLSTENQMHIETFFSSYPSMTRPDQTPVWETGFSSVFYHAVGSRYRVFRRATLERFGCDWKRVGV